MNYYDILEIKKEASQDDIKKSFRRLSKLYHPDTTTDVDKKKELEEKFKKINEAYSVLSDVDKREEYDNPIPRSNPFARHSNPGDIFRDFNIEDLLNNIHGFRNFHFSSNMRGGGNFQTTEILEHTISIDIVKAIEGGSVEFQLHDKTLKIEIPAGIKPNSQVRVRIKGDDKNQTILHLNVHIDLPYGLSKEKLEKLRELLKPEEEVKQEEVKTET